MDNSNMSGDQGSKTGTRDSTYDLTAVLYHALQGVENCQTYMGDAGGSAEHRQFFQQALDSQKKLAEQAKRLLHDALMSETGRGGSMGQQGMSRDSSPVDQGVATGQSHSFSEAQDDGSALRFASGRTEGGSDQFAQGGDRDRQGGLGEDPQSSSFGQDGLGQGQRHHETTTGGGGTSSF
ncbi:hypothetical protein GCM10022280_23350 [Sphingomonas swuensis]|uniref:DUF2383 domain-containing protein n=1 Tax=Sphingomonas swuensis TaxID=977800 RepID=A0ABP7T757_9SPHN